MAADERATVAALDAARAVFRAQIEANQGRVIDMAGDSVLAVFETATGAITAAIAVQDRLAAALSGVPEDRCMRFRVGVHVGDLMEKADGSVYGDGVNIAARLQGLAEPGGITVSDAVKSSLRGKVDTGYEDQGEQSVKNIREPVRAYRIRPGAAGTSAASAAPLKPKLALPEGPSIAVLPLQNMSGDPEQEYFSDGITEDVITDLSKLAGLLVIARNSTFAYKGRATDVRQVGRELGVSHVLEGSVRRIGDRVRITAQLLDAATGHHLWAERYDRNLEDIFALQDEITREIVAALDVRLLRGEQSTAWRHSLRRPEALDAYYRGLDALNRITSEANVQAAHSFGQVIRLEPDSPLGYLGSAWTHLSASRYGWSDSAPLSMQRAAELARKALELDEQCADAHALLGYYHLLSQDHDRAIASGERSVALNPNHADNVANLGCTYAVSGRPGEAIAAMRRAMRLCPTHPAWYLQILGYAHYLCGEYAEAESALTLALQREPAYTECRVMLAGVHQASGRSEDARQEVRELLRREPGFRLKQLEARQVIIKDREMLARYLAMLRTLGLE
jgi:adenylate cyclase